MLFGNEYNWLCLEQLIDTSSNELVVFISQTKKSEPFINMFEDSKVREILSNTMQIVSDETQTYKITFCNYIMYQDRNESYANKNDNEICVGKGLILFEKSSLLKYVYDVIDISLAKLMQQKNKLQHYGIYTLNNIIDVITFNEPLVEKVKK